MSDSFLELRNLKKSFTSEEYVLQGINLQIDQGEFVTLLGASGCGKTTTLRIIAGLEQPDSGSIWLEGKDVTNLEPNQRDVNTVFQNYALFPHMNVADNIGYGLKIRKVPKADIKKKVKEMLELVQLEGFEKRKPAELSGGQKQRVAIARALANNPRVLLLDEPLGALDLQLRRTMQLELKRLQKKLGITFIYITHDQEEAINMSDPLAVRSENILLDEAEMENVVEQNEAEGTGRHLHATVKEKNFAAGQLRVLLALSDGTELTASRFGMNANIQPGQQIKWYFDPRNAIVVDREFKTKEPADMSGGNQ